MASLTLAATGDILIHRPEPNSALAALEPAFATADVTFGNFEGVLTDRHDALPGRGSGTIAATANASGLRAFHVLSLANNHSLDAGYGGLDDTLAALRAMGAKTVGAGRTPAEAWEPAVIDVAGHTVAFVAAASVFRVGYEAKGQRGGIAALAAVDHYAPRFPAAYVPGVPPQIISVASKDDWRRLEIAIETARQRAEFIVVSMHWGDHTRPYVVTDFERDTAKRLSELGVDLVLGHHQHRLRGVEFYGKMPVFFGLGHVVFDQPRAVAELRSNGADWLHLSESQLERRFGRYGHFPRPSGFMFDELARWSAIAIVELVSGAQAQVGYIPVHIDEVGTPRPVRRGSERWNDFLAVMAGCIRDGYLTSAVIDEGRTYAGLPLLSIRSMSYDDTTARGC